MPSSSDELRGKMFDRFGDRISETGPQQYLKDKGWVLNKDWTYSKAGQDLDKIPQDELDCIIFLIQEWDFGGCV